MFQTISRNTQSGTAHHIFNILFRQLGSAEEPFSEYEKNFEKPVHFCLRKVLNRDNTNLWTPGRVAQSVTYLATDACLTADPGVASLIPAWYHTFVEIDHEMLSTVILLPSADLFKKGCCQLQAKVCAQITG